MLTAADCVPTDSTRRSSTGATSAAASDGVVVAVVLADLQDFSYNEIAEIVDCPVGTVMSRLFRGRKRLQEALFAHAVEQGIIDPSRARDEDGALSLAAYRAKKKASGGGKA